MKWRFFILQPLTGKELEYIADSMSNEDLLIKQCLVGASQSQNTAVQQICKQLLTQHQQHYQELYTLLQQHSSVAPKTIEEATQMEQMQQAKTNQQHLN